MTGCNLFEEELISSSKKEAGKKEASQRRWYFKGDSDVLTYEWMSMTVGMRGISFLAMGTEKVKQNGKGRIWELLGIRKSCFLFQYPQNLTQGFSKYNERTNE